MDFIKDLPRMTLKDVATVCRVRNIPGYLQKTLTVIVEQGVAIDERSANWWAKVRNVHRTTWFRHLNELAEKYGLVFRSQGKRFKVLSVLRMALESFTAIAAANRLSKPKLKQPMKSRTAATHTNTNIPLIVKTVMEFADCGVNQVRLALEAIPFVCRE